MVPCYTIERAFLRSKKTKNLLTAYLQAIPPETGKPAEVFSESSNCLMNEHSFWLQTEDGCFDWII